MSFPNNNDRAEYARSAVENHCKQADGEPECLEESVIDLLANLMHLCKKDGVDFGDCLLSAQIHFDAESEG